MWIFHALTAVLVIMGFSHPAIDAWVFLACVLYIQVVYS